jgi:GNAT superfamily N-acetyltransferase
MAVAPSFQSRLYRGTRLVVMPEWQGAGVGTKFLEYVCEFHKRGLGLKGKKFPTMFHTSHPQLIGYLNYSKRWILKSRQLGSTDKYMSVKKKSAITGHTGKKGKHGKSSGGHFRAVQGFKYVGSR